MDPEHEASSKTAKKKAKKIHAQGACHSPGRPAGLDLIAGSHVPNLIRPISALQTSRNGRRPAQLRP